MGAHGSQRPQHDVGSPQSPFEKDGTTQTSPVTTSPTDNCDDSDSSYSDDASKEALSPSDYDDLDDDKDPDEFRRLWEDAGDAARPTSGGSGSDGNKSESPPPYSNKPPSRASSNGSASSGGSGSSGAESSRARRLRDLDEIMKQIDEQARRLVEARERDSKASSEASSPSQSVNHRDRKRPTGKGRGPISQGNTPAGERESLSPGGHPAGSLSPGSAPTGGRRSSDTEADRMLPHGSFYRQTDAETGQIEEVRRPSPESRRSPDSPRAEVKYVPNVKPSATKNYVPLQIHIPNKGKKERTPPKSLSPLGQHNLSLPPTKEELYSTKNHLPSIQSKGIAPCASPEKTSSDEPIESPSSPLSPMSVSRQIPEMPQIIPRRVSQNPAFNKGLYQNLPPPISPRKTLLGQKEKSPLLRVNHEKLLARNNPLTSVSPEFLHSRSSPPKYSSDSSTNNSGSEPSTLTAIPYRGVKTSEGAGALPSSPPTTPRKHVRPNYGTSTFTGGRIQSPDRRLPKKSTPEPPPRNSSMKLTHPLLDGYPFRRNNSPTGQSTSEGYHSDRADTDPDAFVVREIPLKRKNQAVPEPPVSPNQRQSYHEATSPDYVEM